MECSYTASIGCGRTFPQGFDERVSTNGFRRTGFDEGGRVMAEHEDLQHIDALLEELRVIDPPEEFRRNAVASDPEIYARAEADPEAFWAEQAGALRWSRPWDTVMEWNPPWVK